MKKKLFQSVLCIVFVVLFLLSALPFSASAVTVDAKLIDSSDVYTDLKNMGIDPTKYPKDIDAKHIRMLHFIEYGYDYGGDQRDYGLYVYVYNPSGKELDLSPYKNYVQLRTFKDFNESSEVRKMELEKCSVSLREGYEHVFYKFRVKDATKLLEGLQKTSRIYEVSSLELRFKDVSYDQDSTVSARYTYSGFMPYHGTTETATNTLRHTVTDTFTLELDLRPATWKTKTSDKGAGYQYELFSTYFAVPNDVIRDYGDFKAPTKGLIAVDGEYEEYKVNGVVTSNDTVYNAVYDGLFRKSPSFGISGGYPLLNYDNESYNGGFCFNYDVWTGESILTLSKDEKPYELGWMRDPDLERVPYISSVLLREYEQMQELSADVFLTKIKEIEAKYGYPCALLKSANNPYYGHYDYSVKAGNDLSQQLANYAASNNSGLLSFLRGEYGLYQDSKDDVYSGINSIQVIDPTLLDQAKTDEYWSKTYFIQESEVNALQSYLRSHSVGETVYKINFAVRDYYICPITVFQGDNKWTCGQGNYYFEKSTFRNFDVLSLTWQNEHGDVTVLPVAALPIDIVGSITPPAGDDKFKAPGDDSKPRGCALADYKPLVLILGVLLFIFAANWLLKLFGLSIGKIFSAIGRFFGWLFGFATTQNERRRRHKREDDEHTWAREDRDYKRRDYEYKDAEEKRKAADERRKKKRHKADMRAADDHHEEHEWRRPKEGSEKKSKDKYDSWFNGRK